ncbi:MAG: polysaccharide lyase [Bacteroidota bacterium]|nr:polysaccharide lyase [Bacteroidota bacterium]
MKTKLLLSISLLSLFTAACETEELVQPDAKPDAELTTASNVSSVDSYRNNLMVEERFENGLGGIFNRQTYKSHSFGISSAQSRTGSKAARLELRKSDGKVRSEILLPAETSSNRWYGFSMYLPSGYWQNSMASDTWDIIAQWHALEDRGESARFPPIALVVSKGRLQVVMYWATRSTNTNSTISGKKVFDLGPVIKDRWIDFVFHINFSHQSNGVLDVWFNGTKAVSFRGPNSYNDNQYPYFKTGIYKRDWGSISKRALFIDDIRTGTGSADYRDVAPSGSGSNNPNPPSEDEDENEDVTSGQKLASFTLINADTDRDIMTISDGATIDLSNIGTRNLNVRANTYPSSVGSVAFALTGADTETTTQTGKPYALFGDSGGDYNSWWAKTGSYTLKGTPYTGSNKSGTAGTPLSVSFKIVE